MKITGIRLDRHTIEFKPKYPWEERSVGPLDIYDDYNRDQRNKKYPTASEYKDGMQSGIFLTVTTDEGLEGSCGPIENRHTLLTAADGLAGHLIGRDPLDTRLLWDVMSRFDRHSRSGIAMMAISAVDIALWDLKGKILGQPVYKLLGGGRARIRPYMSALGFSLEPKAVHERALWIRDDLHVGAQKWFFRHGPADGTKGMRKNLEMAFLLRETLGEDYELMFDCSMGWTISYAKAMFRELEQVHPTWVEEVLRSHMLDGFRALRDDTSIPLSAGEHIYTRMEVNAYLQENIFAVMQSDPVWCGGITEALKIADLCEMYGTTFIPHGHSLMPAMHVVASMPPDICPYCEYLLNIMDRKNAFFKYNRLGTDGWFTINDTPGLGEELDFERIVKSETVTGFSF